MTMAKKKDPIAEAKALLTANGYEVKSRRPDPKIGDVVRFRDDGMDVLIAFHQTDAIERGDEYVFGGVPMHIGGYDDIYTEPMWIDRREWEQNDGAYEVVGHVDLTKYTKIH